MAEVFIKIKGANCDIVKGVVATMEHSIFFIKKVRKNSDLSFESLKIKIVQIHVTNRFANHCYSRRIHSWLSKLWVVDFC